MIQLSKERIHGDIETATLRSKEMAYDLWNIGLMGITMPNGRKMEGIPMLLREALRTRAQELP